MMISPETYYEMNLKGKSPKGNHEEDQIPEDTDWAIKAEH